MIDEEDSPYFQALENYTKMVELLSGVRAQFIEHGWHPAHAEVATIELVLGKSASK